MLLAGLLDVARPVREHVVIIVEDVLGEKRDEEETENPHMCSDTTFGDREEDPYHLGAWLDPWMLD